MSTGSSLATLFADREFRDPESLRKGWSETTRAVNEYAKSENDSFERFLQGNSEAAIVEKCGTQDLCSSSSKGNNFHKALQRGRDLLCRGDKPLDAWNDNFEVIAGLEDIKPSLAILLRL